mmetsp:Transcript_44388/g.96306  ORF Transcript_44388/g.96306 Transcript_44388/m.96306 type:complete len:201 (+) Transcript_44388:28-630(+)
MSMFGRGPGLDRLPRGAHRGAVRTFLGGRDLFIMGAHSEYLKRHPHLAQGKPADKQALEECADKSVTQHPSPRHPPPLVAFESRAPCVQLCASIGRGCDDDAMALANNCPWLAANSPEETPASETTSDGVVYWTTKGGAKAVGCDQCIGDNVDPDVQYGGAVHSPSMREDTGECLVASWAALGCEGEEPPHVTRKFCGCV